MIGAPCQSSNLLTRTRTVSSRQIRQRGSLRSKPALTGSADLVIVLIRKWLQPSGFTQNVQRTQRIGSGQGIGVFGLILLFRERVGVDRVDPGLAAGDEGPGAV